jgi:two-component system sensor histidine kinase KdpD
MMNYFQKHPYISIVLRHLAAILCIAVTTLILKPIEPNLEIQLITLLYLLPVILSTVLWGLAPGVLAAFLAFLAFNYFFIQPYFTFQVHQTQDLITLIIFLIVAVVMSQLIGQAREGLRLAHHREWEATRMYELISALASLQETKSIAQALANHTQETFQSTRVEVTIGDVRTLPVLTAFAPSNSIPQSTPALFSLPLKTARGQEGEMRLWQTSSQLSSQETRLLEAYTSQGALSLERIRLAKSENKARVLEESDQLKSSLLNSVSHELRSPLAAIKASVSSLRSGAVDWNIAAREELLATIEEETDHLNLLVGNLLDMSRIESGAMKPLKKWNAIGEIVTGVVTKMHKQLLDHPLEIDFPQDLPLVPTDYVMIEQVFTNLISNSVKYAPVNTAIELIANVEREFLHIQVLNHSPAVPVEHLERIFDKFYRVTAADRITGTGLGLSICKGIVEAHGGRIWAENQPDHFVFHFTLPLSLDGVLPKYPQETIDE